jgi:hypothetical protein
MKFIHKANIAEHLGGSPQGVFFTNSTLNISSINIVYLWRRLNEASFLLKLNAPSSN